MPALAAQLPAAGSVLAAAAAARDAGAAQPRRRRRPGVRHRLRRASARCPPRWSPPSGADVRLRTPAHGLRRTATGLRALDRPRGRARAADRRRRDRHRPGRRRRPGCWRDAGPGRGRAAAGHPVRVDGRGRDGVPGAGGRPPAPGCSCRRSPGGWSRASPSRRRKWPHLAGDAAAGPVLGRPVPRRVGAAARRRRPDRRRRRRRRRPARTWRGPSRWRRGWCAGAAGCRSTWSAIRAGSRRSGRRSATVPGLAIAGAAFEGVGVPACIRDAYRAVGPSAADRLRPLAPAVAEDTAGDRASRGGPPVLSTSVTTSHHPNTRLAPGSARPLRCLRHHVLDGRLRRLPRRAQHQRPEATAPTTPPTRCTGDRPAPRDNERMSEQTDEQAPQHRQAGQRAQRGHPLHDVVGVQARPPARRRPARGGGRRGRRRCSTSWPARASSSAGSTTSRACGPTPT